MKNLFYYLITTEMSFLLCTELFLLKPFMIKIAKKPQFVSKYEKAIEKKMFKRIMSFFKYIFIYSQSILLVRY